MLIIRMPNRAGAAGVAAAFGARARYDSVQGSGYQDQLPAIGNFDASSMTAPGSDGVGTQPNDLAVIASGVTVTTPGSSSQPPQPVTDVNAGDSGVPSQPESLGPQGLSGSAASSAPGPLSMSDTGAGHGQAGHHRHPNNANTPTGSAE